MTITRENALSHIIRMAAENVAGKIESRLAGKDLTVLVTRIPGDEQIDTQVIFTDGVIATPPVIFSGKAYPWAHGNYSGPLSGLPE